MDDKNAAIYKAIADVNKRINLIQSQINELINKVDIKCDNNTVAINEILEKIKLTNEEA